MNKRYIEAPNILDDHNGESIFLAGGITGCPDWQVKMAQWILDNTNLIVINPRRERFPMGNSDAMGMQTMWEHEYLQRADYILFWFPSETLCPIALYELGAWSMTDKRIFVGVDPEYARRFEVEEQTRLARPDVEIVYSLFALAEKIEVALMGIDMDLIK